MGTYKCDKGEKDKQNHKNKTQQKAKEREIFHRCTAKCVCSGICKAKGPKECSVCHEIKKSTCSKTCCIDEIKPKMITATTATWNRRQRKYEDAPDSDESDNSEGEEGDAFESESDSFEDDGPENTEVNESADDRNVNVSKKLHEIWCHVSPPINESKIVGKWFVQIHETKQSKRYA